MSPGDRFARPAVELVWPGKNEPPIAPVGGACPHLQVVERYGWHDDARDGEGKPHPWRDALVRGDNLALLRALLEEPWRGRIAAAGGLRLVYLDPPFLTGQDRFAEVRIGDGPGPDGRPRVARLPAFRDVGPRDLPAYLSEMRERLLLVRELLADDGSLYLHCDHRLSAYLRLLLDEVFGPDRFVNELVWHYGLGNPGGARAFARKHDTILLYAKTDRYRFHRLRGDVTRAMANKYRHEDEQGRFMLAYGRTYRLKGGKPLDSVWEIPTLAATDGERLGYPTQKPETLLERILRASSDPGDLVADLCAGCGTLPAVATRLGRRWLACDSGRLAVHLTRLRLLALGERLGEAGHGFAGFDLMDLGRDGPAEPSPFGMHRASLAAEVVPAGAGVSIALRGLRVDGGDDPAVIAASLRPGRSVLAIDGGRLVRLSRDRAGTLACVTLTERWSDWLDTWAVDLGGARQGDSCFRADWVAFREPGRRALPLESPPLAGGAAGPNAVVVRAATVTGEELTVRLPASPGFGRPAPTCANRV